MSAYQALDLQFIDGQWQTGTSTRQLKNMNPFTQQIIFEWVGASIVDVDSAYTAAQRAFRNGAIQSVEVREQVLERLSHIIEQRRQEIMEWLIKESGSTRLKANIEINAALGIIHESRQFPRLTHRDFLESQDPQRQSIVLRKPLGVITVISPWNFPFHLSMRSVVAAIASGNTVLLKPASDTPVTGGTLLAKLFEEAGLPQGVFNVLTGSSSEIGDYIIEHPTPKLISFTGSTEVGQSVAAKALSSSRIKRLALELGGNAPLVILDDADLDMAVELSVMGRFLHQGQICMSTNRIIVDRSLYADYLEQLIARVKTIQCGDPDHEDTLIGPIINVEQVNKIQSKIQHAVQQGAELIYAGGIDNQVVAPHIFIQVTPDMDIALEESFGPVLPILIAENEAQALELANATRFGLSSAVCTSNIERGLEFAEQLDIGMTHINGISVADHANAPFGGERNSGLGRFNGRWIFEEFTRTHWVTTPK